LFLQRNEAGKAMQLMRESTRENVSTILWASAKLNGAGQRFEIPVDTTVERITFTFSVDTKGSTLVLKRPGGLIVDDKAAQVEDAELNCGRLITVVKPQPGIWQADVNGSGTYWLEAQAQSEIYFITAEFVKPGGRPGHEGLFKIQGQPLAGEHATMQASVSASEARTTDFSFVSERGDVLKRIQLKASSEDREFMEFVGDVALPDAPFRLAVSGEDARGSRFQRFYAPLFHAESVEVIPKVKFDDIAPGSVHEAEFEIRNLGAPRNFKVVVTDSRRFATFGETCELNLGARGTSVLKVKLTVPGSAAKGVEDDLVVVVSSTSGAATTNSAIVRLTVSGGPTE